MISAGRRRHRVTLATPGIPEPDGDGGYIETYAPLDPAVMYAEIKPATARDLERIAHGTVISAATHVVTMPFHPGVTTKTVIAFNGRILNVTGLANPDERRMETIVVCVEMIDAPPLNVTSWIQAGWTQ